MQKADFPFYVGMFFGNCKSVKAKKLTIGANLRLLNRAVLPVLRHRCSRWPGNRATFDEIRSVQRKMVAAIVRLPAEPGEDAVTYVRRRNAAMTNLISRDASWNLDYCNRLAAWDAHLHRPRNKHSWPSKMVGFQASEWLEAHRAMRHCGTGTRVSRGGPATRWHEGIEFAEKMLKNSASSTSREIIAWSSCLQSPNALRGS